MLTINSNTRGCIVTIRASVNCKVLRVAIFRMIKKIIYINYTWDNTLNYITDFGGSDHS